VKGSSSAVLGQVRARGSGVGNGETNRILVIECASLASLEMFNPNGLSSLIGGAL